MWERITRELLSAGSYLLHITRPYHAPVDLPLLLTRGERERVHLALPIDVPPGYSYVPPGCFLLGTAGLLWLAAQTRWRDHEPAGAPPSTATPEEEILEGRVG